MKTWLRRLAALAQKAGIGPIPISKLEYFNQLFFYRELLQQYRINLVIDVGANKGIFSSKMRDLGFTGTLMSFEPIPDDFGIVKQLSDGDTNWHAFPYALGNTEGEMEFHHIIAGSGASVHSSLLSYFTPPLRYKAIKKIPVQVRRLSSFIGNINEYQENPRIFLKIDTEGYDLYVIQGAVDLLDSIVAVQTELFIDPPEQTGMRYSDIIDFYLYHGFNLLELDAEAYQMMPREEREIRKTVRRLHAMNAVFIKETEYRALAAHGNPRPDEGQVPAPAAPLRA